MSYGKQKIESIFIFTCFCITISCCIFINEDPRIKEGGIYISNTVQATGYDDTTEERKETTREPNRSDRKSKTGVNKLTTRSAYVGSDKTIQPIGWMYENDRRKYTVNKFPRDSLANRVFNKALYLRGIDWSLTLMGENGSFKIDKQSDCISSGTREHSYGFCQLAQKYHAPFIWNTGYVYNPKTKKYVVDEAVAIAGGHTKEFMDREKQLDYCTEVWDDAKRKGTMPFNAYWSRKENLDKITLIR